jgi:Beta xylosidase C-terminal Concanavalin A-like domain
MPIVLSRHAEGAPIHAMPAARANRAMPLSPAAVGDFTGAYLGMYASSNGTASTASADFDWFEYVGREYQG